MRCRLRVLVFLLANVLDGFALLLKAGVRGEDVSRVKLQSERVFPNITQPSVSVMGGEYKKGRCQKQQRREKSKLVPMCVTRSVTHASRERNTGSKGINETK